MKDTQIGQLKEDVRVAQLKEIAAIRLGYPFRSSIERDEAGTVGVIQMKDFDSFNRLDLSDVYKVQIKDLEDWHLLEPGDILFRSRGVSNTAAIVIEAINQVPDIDKFVVPASLIVLRVKSSEVDPAYLLWYLNHPQCQRQLSRLSRGTNQQMISKSALETLALPLPPLAKQTLVVELAALSLREQELLGELTLKRKMYADAVLQGLAQGKLVLETERLGRKK